MSVEKRIGATTVKLVRDDITRVAADAMVYYARPDLVLGSGHGNAIAIRGGPTIQDAAKKLAPVAVGEAVATTAGELPAKYIVHAVGPRFQEADLETKLRRTADSALRCAEKLGVHSIVLPPMGAGFFGVPLDMSAKVILGSVRTHLERGAALREVVICVGDTREYGPFEAALRALA